jgi:hypothetical protein
MGCKCGRDLLFGDNEIIKAESIRAHYNKKTTKIHIIIIKIIIRIITIPFL